MRRECGGAGYDAFASQVTQDDGYPRPEEGADEGRRPVGGSDHEKSAYAVNPQHHGLVSEHQHEHAERLLPQGEPPQPLATVMDDERQQRESERMLAEQGARHDIQEQARHPGDHDSYAIRHREAPVHEHQSNPRRTADRRPGRHRQGAQHQRDHQAPGDRPVDAGGGFGHGTASPGRGRVATRGAGCSDHTSSTSRLRSRSALDSTVTWAKGRPLSRLTLTTRPTG